MSKQRGLWSGLILGKYVFDTDVTTSQACIYSVTHPTQQQANYKRFLETSFGSKIEPAKGLWIEYFCFKDVQNKIARDVLFRQYIGRCRQCTTYSPSTGCMHLQPYS